MTMRKSSAITGLMFITKIRDEHPNMSPYEVANTAFWRANDRIEALEDALLDVIELGDATAAKIARRALGEGND